MLPTFQYNQFSSYIFDHFFLLDRNYTLWFPWEQRYFFIVVASFVCWCWHVLFTFVGFDMNKEFYGYHQSMILGSVISLLNFPFKFLFLIFFIRYFYSSSVFFCCIQYYFFLFDLNVILLFCIKFWMILDVLLIVQSAVYSVPFIFLIHEMFIAFLIFVLLFLFLSVSAVCLCIKL